MDLSHPSSYVIYLGANAWPSFRSRWSIAARMTAEPTSQAVAKRAGLMTWGVNPVASRENPGTTTASSTPYPAE